MSLSRSPSPKRGGGWASPGLNANFAQSRSSTPVTSYSQSHSVTWASAQARSHQVNGYPAYQDAGSGFFGKHMRKISASLPFFSNGPKDERQAEKEKTNRARWAPARGGYFANFKAMIGRHALRSKSRFVLLLVILLLIVCFYTTRKSADKISPSLSILTQ
jgi:mannan polymerase II complex MNN10 subunit